MSTTTRLTPHQREVYERLARLSLGAEWRNPRTPRWVDEKYIGSHSAVWRLIAKGYVEHTTRIGPRGGRHYLYRPVERVA